MTKCCNNVSSSQRHEPENGAKMNIAEHLQLSTAAPLLVCLLLATATKICFGGKAREGKSLLGRSFAH